MVAPLNARQSLPPGIGSRRGSHRSYLWRPSRFDLKLLDAVSALAKVRRAEFVRMLLREQAAERLLIDNLYPVRVRAGFRLWRADGAKYALDVLTPCAITDGTTRAWVEQIAFDPPREVSPSGGGAVLRFPAEVHALYLVDFEAVRSVLRGGHGPAVDTVAGWPTEARSCGKPSGSERQKRWQGGMASHGEGSGGPAATDHEIPAASHVSRAVALLRDFLTVPRPSGDDRPDGVPAFARAHGIGRSTLRTAREALGVVAEKAGGTFRGGWTWRLPGCDAPLPSGRDVTDGTAAPARALPAALEDRALDSPSPGPAPPGTSPPPTSRAAPSPRPCDAPGHLWVGRWIDWFGGGHCTLCEPPDMRLARPTEGPPPTA